MGAHHPSTAIITMPRSRTPSRLRPAPLTNPIFREQLSRNEQFFKTTNQHRIEASYIVVVGLGGVGSHAAHMFSRAGVGRLRLIDFDQVTLSSLNRHAVATRADVGITKVEACKRHFHEFNPLCHVEAVPRMFTEEAAEELILGRLDPQGKVVVPDYVIDCIDDATTKAALVSFCIHHQVPLICSLAAGGKSDPTRIRIGDLADPMCDPLAKKLRTVLRTSNSNAWKWLDKPGIGDDGGRKHTNVTGALPPNTAVKVVYSTQKPVCPLEPLTAKQKKEGASNYGAVENFRVRVMPVLGTVPALFGMSAASFVLCELGKKQFAPLASRKMSAKTIRKVRDKLKRSEYQDHQVDEIDFAVSEDEVAYLMEHVWHMRCAYTGVHMEGSRAKKLCLKRWNVALPASVQNLILLTESSGVVHDRMTRRSGSVPRLGKVGVVEKEDAVSGGGGGTRKTRDKEPTREVLEFAERAVTYCITAEEYNFQRVKWGEEELAGGGNGGGLTVASLGKHALLFFVVLLVAVAVGVILNQTPRSQSQSTHT